MDLLEIQIHKIRKAKNLLNYLTACKELLASEKINTDKIERDIIILDERLFWMNRKFQAMCEERSSQK